MEIAGYRIERELHSGAHALVYRARRDGDGAPVILKVARPTAAAVGKLAHEYEIAHGLTAEGVARIHGFERSGDLAMLVVEDFGASSLREHAAEQRLDIESALRIAIQVVSAIAEVHHAGIVHMDINPANILVHSDTGRVKVCDFGIASVLQRENWGAGSSMFQGTLAYISPEQTGRMNRTVDYRTDFYSFGVTLYEMLIGWLPFQTDDAMELVHSHIARRPPAPHELNASIPVVLSDIVMKLMAKTAEERYQSAFGITADLERCLRGLESAGTIEAFTLASRDVSGTFHVPEKLYGREAPLKELFDAFERSSLGGRGMVFVSGESGVGKSSLINEVHRPVVRQKGYFIAGKCDQFKHHLPYAALIQAFQDLIRQLLTESDARVALWRERINAVMGSNGRLLTDVIPELTLIVGEQPPVEQLAASEARNRFALVIRDFIAAIARREHPLVLFIDDLQWVDVASLEVFESVLNDTRTEYFLCIGAYRDNEVTTGHPLLATMDALTKKGVPLHHIGVERLSGEHLNQLLADTLRCPDDRVHPLADIVRRKTGGNPSFVLAFLKALHRQNLLRFDADHREWTWDLDGIYKSDVTDNVVELMRANLAQLPEGSRSLLALAAFIGNVFDLQTLAKVAGQSSVRTAQELWAPLREGLLLPIGDAYKFIYEEDADSPAGVLQAPTVYGDIRYRFAHDQVQQAAYGLVAEADEAATHLRIGRAMWEAAAGDPRDDVLFGVINQINAGAPLVSEPAERVAYARMNAVAGQRARASNAYAAALTYLDAGMKFLPANAGAQFPDLVTTLNLENAESCYILGKFEDAERLYDEALRTASDGIEKARIYQSKVNLYNHLSRWNDAIDAGQRGLKLLGVDFPSTANKAQVALALLKVRIKLGRRKVRDLAAAPDRSDARVRLAGTILWNLVTVTYFVSEELAGLTIVRLFDLALTYGNADFAPIAYSEYGLVVAEGFKAYEQAYQLGQLALEVAAHHGRPSLSGTTRFTVAITVNCWRSHLRTSIDMLRAGALQCREGGDLLFLSLSLSYEVLIELLVSEPLPQVRHRADEARQAMAAVQSEGRVDQMITTYLLVLTTQFVKSMTGETAAPGDLGGKDFDSMEYRNEAERTGHSVVVMQHMLTQLHAYVMANRMTEAAQLAVEAEAWVRAARGVLTIAELYYYRSMALAATLPSADAQTKKRHLAMIRKMQRLMKSLAASCPDNYEHKYLLVEAELAAAAGRADDATKLYGSAVSSAERYGYRQHVALANERTGRFFLGRDLKDAAGAYLRKAHAGYDEWGATAMCRRLEMEFPEILLVSPQVHTRQTIHTTGIAQSATLTSVFAFDYESVVKAASALSEEIVLDKLLVRLVRIILENAGAEKAVLLLESNGHLTIEGFGLATDPHVDVLQHKSLDDDRQDGAQGLVPSTIVSYVARTHEVILLNNASADTRFLSDPYVARVAPSSVLCYPLVNQGKLAGVLYLENNLTAGAFTADRLEVLAILCSQASVSLTNAVLFQRLEDYSKTLEIKVAERTRDLLAKSAELARNNQDLADEKVRSDELLHNILPKEVAHELMRHGTTTPSRFDHATVVLTDFKDFTRIASGMAPRELVAELNDIFGLFDEIVYGCGLEKVKTIGDAYMYVGGVPREVPDHPLLCVTAAATMLRALHERNRTRHHQWEMRIGIHTGPVVAGVVGKRKFTYDVWGDTVNVASRLESAGEAGRINLSAQTHEFIKGSVRCLSRGMVNAKGKGDIEMFFVDPAEVDRISIA